VFAEYSTSADASAKVNSLDLDKGGADQHGGEIQDTYPSKYPSSSDPSGIIQTHFISQSSMFHTSGNYQLCLNSDIFLLKKTSTIPMI
jgi:hypothetical protein